LKIISLSYLRQPGYGFACLIQDNFAYTDIAVILLFTAIGAVVSVENVGDLFFSAPLKVADLSAQFAGNRQHARCHDIGLSIGRNPPPQHIII
jgi:hypothetical protein